MVLLCSYLYHSSSGSIFCVLCGWLHFFNKLAYYGIFFAFSKDPDEFKSTVKDGIMDWMRKLRDRNVVDWMIIQVISQDSLRGNKPKIPIPRSSVFDKIKSDFGGKNSDRYLQSYWIHLSIIFPYAIATTDPPGLQGSSFVWFHFHSSFMIFFSFMFGLCSYLPPLLWPFFSLSSSDLLGLGIHWFSCYILNQ